MARRRGLFGIGRSNKINKPDTTTREEERQVIESSSQAIWQLVNEIRNINQSRFDKYAEYDLMSTEVIIGAALDMYADDASQKDENSDRVFSVKSNDSNLQKDLYAFLDKIGVEEKAWDTSYNLAKYGNRYWKIYLTPDGKDIDSIEEVDNPASVLDLYYKGKPTYFAQNKEDPRLLGGYSSEFDLYDHDSFVHFFIKSGKESDVIELVDNTNFDDDGNPLLLKYKVIEGEPLIEGVRVIYRILRSLEDSLLAARLAKSDYIRIFNIEVGEATTTDARLIVNKVKKLFDSTVSMNIREGSYNAVKQPRAWADPIFNSVNHGKGSIDINTFGGDFEVKSIVDIDYFNSKLFAGLRIPKPLLGFEESLSGGMNSHGTLVQLDIRYGKFVKKLKDANANGIKDLCNIWLKIRGRESQIGKFDIIYNSPSSTEELAKLEELESRVNVVSNLVDTIVSHTDGGVNKTKILLELLREFVPYQDFIDKIDPLIKPAIDDSDESIRIEKELKSKKLDYIRNSDLDDLEEVDILMNAPTDEGVDFY